MLDASVLIAGSAWPRWPYEVLLAGLRGEFRLVLCPYVIEQARRVLRDRFADHQTRFDLFLELADPEVIPDPTLEEVAEHLGLVRDPTDVPIAVAAIDAGVDFLVSEDKDFTDRGETTGQLHEQLTVVLPGTFLRQVLGWTSDQLEEIRRRSWLDLEED